jgi:hypothetical protein
MATVKYFRIMMYNAGEAIITGFWRPVDKHREWFSGFHVEGGAQDGVADILDSQGELLASAPYVDGDLAFGVVFRDVEEGVDPNGE